jgi:hypothetical protein
MRRVLVVAGLDEVLERGALGVVGHVDRAAVGAPGLLDDDAGAWR